MNNHVSLLFDLIKREKEESESYIREYKYFGDYYKLFREIRVNTSQMLKAAGRVYGNIHVLKDDEFNKSIYEKINNTYMKDLWEPLGTSLENLFSNYPDWKGEQELDNLTQIVFKSWNLMGILPEEIDENQTYIHILR